MKKFLSIIVGIAIFIMIIINIFSILNLSFLGFRVYRVASGSMEPNIKVGSLILIKKSNNYKVGDIVTYKKENQYITHRIISIEKGKVITKGDANNIDDEEFSEDEIVGKMIHKFIVVGFINYLLRLPFTWILLLIIGITISVLIPSKGPRQKRYSKYY